MRQLMVLLYFCRMCKYVAVWQVKTLYNLCVEQKCIYFKSLFPHQTIKDKLYVLKKIIKNKFQLKTKIKNTFLPYYLKNSKVWILISVVQNGYKNRVGDKTIPESHSYCVGQVWEGFRRSICAILFKRRLWAGVETKSGKNREQVG